jgi:hypothetical protein
MDEEILVEMLLYLASADISEKKVPVSLRRVYEKPSGPLTLRDMGSLGQTL